MEVNIEYVAQIVHDVDLQPLRCSGLPTPPMRQRIAHVLRSAAEGSMGNPYKKFGDAVSLAERELRLPKRSNSRGGLIFNCSQLGATRDYKEKAKNGGT